MNLPKPILLNDKIDEKRVTTDNEFWLPHLTCSISDERTNSVDRTDGKSNNHNNNHPQKPHATINALSMPMAVSMHLFFCCCLFLCRIVCVFAVVVAFTRTERICLMWYVYGTCTLTSYAEHSTHTHTHTANTAAQT